MSSATAPAFPAWKSQSGEFDYHAWSVLAGWVYPDTVKLMPEFAPRISWLGWKFAQAGRDGCSWAKELAQHILDHHQGVAYYKDMVIATVTQEDIGMVFTITCGMGEPPTVIVFQNDGYVSLSQPQDKDVYVAKPENHHFMPHDFFVFINTTLGLDEVLPPVPVITSSLTNSNLLYLIHDYAHSLYNIYGYEAYDDVQFVCVDLMNTLCGMRNNEGAASLALGLFMLIDHYDGVSAQSENGRWIIESRHDDIEQTVCLTLQDDEGSSLEQWLYIPNNKTWTKDGVMATKEQLRHLDIITSKLVWMTNSEEPVNPWWENVSRREDSANTPISAN